VRAEFPPEQRNFQVFPSGDVLSTPIDYAVLAAALLSGRSS
jgi:hypothetical protein